MNPICNEIQKMRGVRRLLAVSILVGLTLFAGTVSYSAESCADLLKISGRRPEITQPASTQPASTKLPTDGQVRIQANPGVIENLSGPILGNLINILFPKGIIAGKFEKQSPTQVQTHNRTLLKMMLADQFFKPLTKILEMPELASVFSQFSPQFQIGQGQYKLKLKRVQVTPIEILADELNLQGSYEHGAIFKIEVEVSSMEVSITRSEVSLFDDGKGKASAQGAKVNTKSPISLQIPIFFGVHKNGLPDFQVLGIKGPTPNQFQLELSKLSLPSVQLIIDGKAVVLPEISSFEAVQNKFLEELSTPEAVAQMSSSLVNFFNKSVVQIIQSKFTQARGLELKLQVNPVLLPVGVFSKNLVEPIPLQLNAWPQVVNQNSATLAVAINMESHAPKSGDKTAPRELGPCPFACQFYDVAMTANREILEASLEQSFKMGLLNNLETPQGSISIIEPPQILNISASRTDANGSPSTPASIQLGLHIKPESIKGLPDILKNQDFSMKLKVTLNVSPGKNGNAIKIEVVRVEPNQAATSAVGTGAASSGGGFFDRMKQAAADAIKNQVQQAALSVLSGFLQHSSGLNAIQIALPEAFAELLGPLKIVGLGFGSDQNLHVLLKQ